MISAISQDTEGSSTTTSNGAAEINVQIKLLEKQVSALTLRNQELFEQIQFLHRASHANQQMHDKLWSWFALGLSNGLLPQTVIDALMDVFQLDGCALCVWGEGVDSRWQSFGKTVSDSLIQFASSLSAPYTGPRNQFYVENWLPSHCQSLAIVPLIPAWKWVVDEATPVQGLLVMGSAHLHQFSSTMDSTFIQKVGHLLAALMFSQQPLGS